MKYLIFGGAGALGRVLVKRIRELGENAIIFSRDEAKHHYLKQDFPLVDCVLGDIRNYDSVQSVINNVKPDYVINCAALKQVPACELQPDEAILTNINGTQNIVKALKNYKDSEVQAVFISTDKAAKPVNSYGMTKSLAERIWIRGNDYPSNVKFNCTRYGNVLESTGSVIPVFKERIKKGLEIKITHPEMTRFLMSLEDSVDLIFKALESKGHGNIFIPKVKSAYIRDLALCLVEYFKSEVPISYGKIRPGEKIHEILISEEELFRTINKDDVYIVRDFIGQKNEQLLELEYSSGSLEYLMSYDELKVFLKEKGVFDEI